MSATIVVGGQYGSEGKGKVATLIAMSHDRPWVVRCGGPNSGHTTQVFGTETVLRQLPSAVEHPHALFALAAGCVVDEELLIEEIEKCNLDPKRVYVDSRGILLTDEDRYLERGLHKSIGSTGSGNGNALSRRMMRRDDVRLVEHSSKLKKLVNVTRVAPLLHDAIESGIRVLVEGTQGFGLSLLHGDGYPFLTSKDTTANSFAMEAGIPPSCVDEIVMVVRTFPIRVGGPSGELQNEVSWEEIKRISGAPLCEPEYTSVTNRLRRVGRFDLDSVFQAVQFNRPTQIAVMGLDRLDYKVRGVTDYKLFTPMINEFLGELRDSLKVPITWGGTGFSVAESVSLVGKEIEISHG